MAPVCSGREVDGQVLSIQYCLPTVHRKFTKHLVEKKRRDRINQSLEQLKELLIGTVNVDLATFEKMEKADILQMTVEYMKRLASLPATSDKSSCHWYNSGYDECHRVAHGYLRSTRLGHDLKTRLVCDAHPNTTINGDAVSDCRPRQRYAICDVTSDSAVYLNDRGTKSLEKVCDVYAPRTAVYTRTPLKTDVCSNVDGVWRPW